MSLELLLGSRCFVIASTTEGCNVPATQPLERFSLFVFLVVLSTIYTSIVQRVVTAAGIRGESVKI